MSKNILIGLLLIVIVLIGLNYYYSEPETIKEVTVKTDTVIIVDSFHSISYVPQYYKVVDTVIERSVVDTQLIINNYFTKKYYSDTLFNDSVLQIVVNDTLYRNEIISREPYIRRKNHIITKEINTTEYKHDNGFYMGVVAGQNLGITADYKYNYNTFGVIYDKQGFSVKYSRKINFRRK